MKRNRQQPNNPVSEIAKSTAQAIQSQVDLELASLLKNEDDIIRVMNELSKRDISLSQKEFINSSFESYSKVAKHLTDYMEGM